MAGPGDGAREVRGNRFQHDRERAGLFERRASSTERVASAGGGLAWIAADAVHRLRQESEMSHHRNADVDEPLDDVEDRAAAFELRTAAAPPS